MSSISQMRPPAVRVRPLAAEDVSVFLSLIDALADYERLPRPTQEARARLSRDATSDPPRFRVLLAEVDGRVAGYSVYFETYSTFLARPTLFIEDLFVLEQDRRLGVGEALVRELAREAIRRECGRIEWQVLAWNQPAIDFYHRLGGRQLEEWLTYRVTADQFASLAENGHR